MKQEIPRLKAEFFKTLGHPLRIRTLELLSEGERSVSALREETGAEQSHLSQQLGVLRRAGLVDTRRDGSSVIYRLADERVDELLAIARAMMLDILKSSQSELQPA